MLSSTGCQSSDIGLAACFDVERAVHTVCGMCMYSVCLRCVCGVVLCCVVIAALTFCSFPGGMWLLPGCQPAQAMGRKCQHWHAVCQQERGRSKRAPFSLAPAARDPLPPAPRRRNRAWLVCQQAFPLAFLSVAQCFPVSPVL